MTTQALSIHDEMPLSELGAVLVKSGFFQDTRDAAQAIVKVMAGRELGLQAIASMTGIYIVQGRVTLSANIMAAVVKRSGRYDYRVMVLDDKACEIAFFQSGQAIGNSRFTAEDAKRAGTKNMDKFPRNMLFARAMSNGVKWYCPDVTGGPVYTPEELGATVSEDGDVIDMSTIVVQKNGNGHTEPHPEPAPTMVANIGPDFDAPSAPPAPTTEPEAVAVKFATIKGLTHVAEWQKAGKEMSTLYPAYQTVLKGGAPGGQPNWHHILGAAAKCGYAEVNDGNYELVIEAVAKRAATKFGNV
jgi:hypothetical protein